ncbi:MAG: hypothetical protein K6B71_03990 [Alphaproteobacteria bacterium]|nr:hypothetical protein [Alphaproteobacteria bacterium]
MKIKIKNFVFAGFAAAMFAGSAMANEGDLDPTVNPSHVTAKSYVDRVVNTRTGALTDLNTTAKSNLVAAINEANTAATNAATTGNNAATKDLDNLTATGKANVSAQGTYDSSTNYTSGTVGAAIKGKQDTISDLETIRSGAAAGATAVQPSGLATINSNIQSLQMNKQNKDDSTVADGTYNIITQGSDVGANLQALDSKIGAVPADSTVMAEIAAAQAEATYDDTALAGRVTTIENSDAYTSGITSTKVGNYDAHIANDGIHVTAAQKTEWSGKQNAIADYAGNNAAGVVTNVTQTNGAITATKAQITDAEVASGAAIAQSKINGLTDALAAKATNDFVGTLPAGAQATTVTGYIDEAVAAAASDASDAIADLDLTEVGGNGNVVMTVSQADGQVSATAGKIANANVADNAAIAQSKIANLTSGCSEQAPCAWINNVWVPIQQ